MVKCFINGELVEKVRFPITEVGNESTVTMTIENNLMEDIELIPFVGDREVSIKEYPRKLMAGESGKAIWVFSPSEERIQSLNCECGFKEIIG